MVSAKEVVVLTGFCAALYRKGVAAAAMVQGGVP